ncbi:bifunctional precorrin-2 dehydrogenase/sirohydrochlorin ferrochelatase [Shewanella intestini]|uniref:precorrin-2 dehydrogenase n=1 Tax=Shewanella intestini TaxID=2017544 RepID=A0ABS5I0B0_9GAMM|nr:MULTISPECIES: bifunctional precorrin-2 dehydrogenase/sirohydrochlorin ferrochelatase [Shewanella]MBR9727456.1 bifunctional precorrin-2 dehydrogenase/sirohydrochlorin ferrochelatase [Shewanella intestini]MRG35494.1 bifunctional precorrin-2 dehydrogenase/sirohydrochlorin ferrochelatase [Shewanella sp. XMDDZSB0408]
MQYFPIFVDTQNIRVLVVGAGEVASRKIDLLARTQSQIEVIAPDISDEVQAYQQQGRIKVIQREVQESDIDQYDLIYLATANNTLNSQLSIIAAQRHIWANVVDNPSRCQFITPSIVDRGKLTVAISTSGAAPVFARSIRAKLEALLPQSLAPLFEFVANKRLEVQQKLISTKDRRLFWERFFQQNGDRFDQQTEKHYQQAFTHYSSAGEILLIDESVDAHLLPIAALPLLQRIDTVYSDQPIASELLELLRRDASRLPLITKSAITECVNRGDKILLLTDTAQLNELTAYFPAAKHLRTGNI